MESHSVIIEPGGAAKALEAFLSEQQVKRIFLVSGKSSYQASGARDALAPLLEEKELLQFSEFQSNPTFEMVLSGAKLCAEFAPDIILAVGGGSSIDVAKSIAAIATDIDNSEAIAKGEVKAEKGIAPLVAVPTTAGSGSEATHFAVMYVDGTKYSLASDALMPVLSIVDAYFTYDAPKEILAPPAFDALFQAIESYWAVAATEESMQYAEKAILLIKDALLPAVLEGDRAAKNKMAEGAYWAGRAINISKTTAPHAYAYHLTQKYGVPHGEAVGIMLSLIAKYTERMSYRSLMSTGELENRIGAICRSFRVQNMKELSVSLVRKMEQCGLCTTLTMVGCDTSEKCEELFSNANVVRMFNHPVDIDRDLVVEIFD